MLSFSVKLDAKRVGFNLGTKKQAVQMFMARDEVAAVEQKQVGKLRKYAILGKDGSRAAYSLYTSFRPAHVARKIAESAGLTVQKI